MRNLMRAGAGAASLALLIGLAGCASSTPTPEVGADVVAPITMTVTELSAEASAGIELVEGQTLNITTGEAPVDAFEGDTDDAGVAEFSAGRVTDSAEFNPGFVAVAKGSTEAWIEQFDDPASRITFTITVVEHP